MSARSSRVSARLQSLYTGGPADKTDWVTASRYLRARKWVRKPKQVATFWPVDQPAPTPELLALKDRPPPTVRKALKRRRPSDTTGGAESSTQRGGGGEDEDDLDEDDLDDDFEIASSDGRGPPSDSKKKKSASDRDADSPSPADFFDQSSSNIKTSSTTPARFF